MALKPCLRCTFRKLKTRGKHTTKRERNDEENIWKEERKKKRKETTMKVASQAFIWRTEYEVKLFSRGREREENCLE